MNILSYYEDEVPKVLEIGKEYTEREIYLFVVNNKYCSVISKSRIRLDNNGISKLTIIEILEGYEHKGDGYMTYNIPSRKSKIYIIN